MRSFASLFILAGAGFASLIAAHSAAAVPAASKDQIDPRKYNVCSVTINSSNEINAFKKVLGTKKFNYIELTKLEATEKEQEEMGSEEGSPTRISPDYLALSCKRQIRCDILVISGHFGGKFFDETGANHDLELDLDDLEVASCMSGCRATIQKPKEVFLFGCNTLAGKQKDFRTPDQYRDALLSHGFDNETAEQMVAFRYSSFGDSFAERMAGVFKSTPRIYGFDSIAPSGKNVESMLINYLRKAEAEGYYSQGKFMAGNASDNSLLRISLRQTSFAQTPGQGEQKYQSALCYLKDPTHPQMDKFKFISDALTGPNMLAHLPVINKYLTDLNSSRYGDGPVEWTDKNFEYFENTSRFAKAKQVMDDMIAKNFDAILSMQMNALRFERMMGWITEAKFLERSQQLLLGDEKTKWSRARFDTVRSIVPDGFKITVGLDKLPLSKFNDPDFITLLSSFETSNDSVLAKYIEISESESASVGMRGSALKALFHSQEHKIAHDYLYSIIEKRGSDGVLRLAATGGFRSVEKNRDIFDAIAKVVSNESLSTRIRFSAWQLSSNDDESSQRQAEDIFRKLLKEYAVSSSALNYTTEQLCLNTAIFLEKRSKIALSLEEQRTLLKIGMICSEGYGSSIPNTLLQQKELNYDIVDSIVATRFAKDSGNINIDYRFEGIQFKSRLLDPAKMPKTAAVALEKMKKAPSLPMNSTVMFALGLSEGQQYVLDRVMKDPKMASVGWDLLALPQFSDGNRIRLMDYLMSLPGEKKPFYMLRAILYSPSLAARYLKMALDPSVPAKQYLRFSNDDLLSLGVRAARSEFHRALIQLLNQAQNEQYRETLLTLVALSRPQSEVEVEKFRQLSRSASDNDLRIAASLALYAVKAEPISPEVFHSSKLTTPFVILGMSLDSSVLMPLARAEIDSENGFRAIHYVMSPKVPASEPKNEYVDKFIKYQIEHRNPNADLTDYESYVLVSTGLLKQLSVEQLVKLENWVRGTKLSVEKMKFAFTLGEVNPGSVSLQKTLANIIRTATPEDYRFFMVNQFVGEGYAESVYEAAIDRLLTSTTPEDIQYASALIKLKYLSLRQINRLRAYKAQLKDPRMIEQMAAYWTSGSY